MRTPWLIAIVMLAGCADPSAETSMPAPGDSTTLHSMDHTDDLSFSGVVDFCDEGHCLHATASNEGSRTYYTSNICVPPFSESMTHDGKTVYPREPMSYCAAFGLGEFTGGTNTPYNATWDGRLWDDESGEMQDAPAGTYTWSTTFRAYEEQDGGASIDLTISFEIIIA